MSEYGKSLDRKTIDRLAREWANHPRGKPFSLNAEPWPTGRGRKPWRDAIHVVEDVGTPQERVTQIITDTQMNNDRSSRKKVPKEPKQQK